MYKGEKQSSAKAKSTHNNSIKKKKKKRRRKKINNTPSCIRVYMRMFLYIGCAIAEHESNHHAKRIHESDGRQNTLLLVTVIVAVAVVVIRADGYVYFYCSKQCYINACTLNTSIGVVFSISPPLLSFSLSRCLYLTLCKYIHKSHQLLDVCAC